MQTAKRFCVRRHQHPARARWHAAAGRCTTAMWACSAAWAVAMAVAVAVAVAVVGMNAVWAGFGRGG